MKLGYYLESQNEDYVCRQLNSLEWQQVDIQYVDEVGETTQRDQMLGKAMYGDIIFCHSFDVLAQSPVQLLCLMQACMDRGIIISFLHEGISSDMENFTSIAEGYANMEQAVAQRRRLSGIQKAKERGVYTGRVPLTYREFEVYYEKYKCREYPTKVVLADELGVSRGTLDRMIESYLYGVQNGCDMTSYLVTLPKIT